MASESTSVARRVLPNESKDNDASFSSQSHQQIQQSIAMNFINKEPFNEDVEPEESSLYTSDRKWRTLVIEAFRRVIDEIQALREQDLPENKIVIKEKYQKGLILCSTIKKLNRLSHIKVNAARIRTHEEKSKIDEYHLELKNLLYEISYLKKEMKKCLEFRSLHEDIELVAPDEIQLQEGGGSSNENDQHALKLSQLNFELVERQQMTARTKELENLIDLHERQLKSKQIKLESLQPKLQSILDACKPTLDYFTANFDEDCVASDLVQNLPKPLYHLFVQMSAYRDTIDKDVVRVEVCGDLDEAKKLNDLNSNSEEDQEKQIKALLKISGSNNENDDDQDDEGPKISDSKSNKTDSSSKGNSSSRDRHNYHSKSFKKKHSSSSVANRVFNVFPLSCKVHFNDEEYGQFRLEFFYLPILKIVTMKSELKLHRDTFNISSSNLNSNNNDNSAKFLRSDSMFDGLFEHDSGMLSPNPLNSFLLANLGIKPVESGSFFQKSTTGTPYQWCQMLCGLYFQNKLERKAFFSNVKEDNNANTAANGAGDVSLNSSSLNDVSMEATTTESVNQKASKKEEAKEAEVAVDFEINETTIFGLIVNKLKSKFKYRVVLQDTINTLKKLQVPRIDRLKFGVESSITSFSEISAARFESNSSNARTFLKSLRLNESECVFFELEVKNGPASLQASIVISQNYPKTSPVFLLKVSNNNNGSREKEAQESRTHVNDEALRDIEREVNIYKEFDYIQQLQQKQKHQQKSTTPTSKRSSSSYSVNDLFAKQVNHLMICFDVLLESESYYLEDGERRRNKLFLHACQGRDRKRPYCYLSDSDLFVQRMQFMITSADNE